jgi:hypothetical protein
LGDYFMSDFFVVGASGIRYDYFATPPNPQWKQAAGNYVFVKQTASAWIILYAGQCDDFSKRMPNHERWSDAIALGVTHVFTRTSNGGEAVRKKEEQDIIQGHNPLMNVHHRTDGRSTMGMRR